MAISQRTWYVFVVAIVALFLSSFILVVVGGTGIITALIWCITNLLNVSYPDLIPYALGLNNPYILAADTLGALSFALLTALLVALFFNLIRNLNVSRVNTMRKIRRLQKHVILVPFNTFSEAIMDDLEKANVKTVVLTGSEKEAAYLYAHSKLTVVGDVNSIELLDAAGLARASSIILCYEDPTKNAILAVTTRTFNKKVKIIARVSKEEDLVKLSRTGVHRIILPEISTGLEMGNAIRTRVTQK